MLLNSIAARDVAVPPWKWALVVTLVGMAGCGRGDPPPLELGTVTGTVTLDGKPLPRAVVKFTPSIDGGRTSVGVTDVAGRYALEYTATTKGANVGVHEVRISTAALDGSPNERVPAKFNSETTLSADVRSGENVFDFAL
jgi:hypothetical protein